MFDLTPISEARKKANDKYIKSQDEYKIRMAKGKKDIIKAHAEKQCESANGFINRAIDETMERDNNKK